MFQISFLHSSLLFFTAATLLPLIVWLIAKRKPPKVVIPSLRFVKQSQEEQKKRSQLKNILLLIIRMLIILLITLAIARPQVYSPRLKDSSKHPPTALGIVLDNSFSMDYFHEGKSNLERAKEAINKINGLCNPADKVLLISLDESWNMLHSQVFAGKIPEDLVTQIQITHNPISIADALIQAKDKLAISGLPNRELYLLTDRQAADYPKNFEMDVHLIPLELDKINENISISELKPRSQLVDKTPAESGFYHHQPRLGGCERPAHPGYTQGSESEREVYRPACGATEAGKHHHRTDGRWLADGLCGGGGREAAAR